MIVIIAQPHVPLSETLIVKLIVQDRFSHIGKIHGHTGIVRHQNFGPLQQGLAVIFRPGSDHQAV